MFYNNLKVIILWSINLIANMCVFFMRKAFKIKWVNIILKRHQASVCRNINKRQNRLRIKPTIWSSKFFHVINVGLFQKLSTMKCFCLKASLQFTYHNNKLLWWKNKGILSQYLSRSTLSDKINQNGFYWTEYGQWSSLLRTSPIRPIMIRRRN